MPIWRRTHISSTANMKLFLHGKSPANVHVAYGGDFVVFYPENLAQGGDGTDWEAFHPNNGDEMCGFLHVNKRAREAKLEYGDDGWRLFMPLPKPPETNDPGPDWE